MDELTKNIAAGILLLTNLVILITQFIQLLKIKKELKEVKVVVNDTHEMREALKKSLEGTWKISGEFSKVQNDSSQHYSTGYAIFTWLPSKQNYEVKYMYSIRKERNNIDIITVICSGHALTNGNGNVDNKKGVILDMIIESRSSENEDSPQSKSFKLTSEKPIYEDGKINTLTFKFLNSNTDGKIIFTR